MISLLYLEGCATLPSQNTSSDDFDKVLSQADQKEFDKRMNVSQDGEKVNWRSDDENSSFQLTADNTRVNEKGQACRDYTLLVHQDYHREKTIHATACRDNGSWE
jgi:surface antigen